MLLLNNFLDVAIKTNVANSPWHLIFNQCRRCGGGEGVVPPLTTACTLRFGLLKTLFLEHHASTR